MKYEEKDHPKLRKDQLDKEEKDMKNQNSKETSVPKDIVPGFEFLTIFLNKKKILTNWMHPIALELSNLSC